MADSAPTAGYIFIAVKALPGDPTTPEEQDAAFSALFPFAAGPQQLPESATLVFHGRPYGAYELARAGPPHCAILQFPDQPAAKTFAETSAVLSDREKFLAYVDLRVVEAAADLFASGSGCAFWCAWLADVTDGEKNAAYIGASIAASEAGFAVTDAEKFSWQIKHLSGSAFYGRAEDLVAKKGEGKPFVMPGCETDMGLVAVLELGKGVGKRVRECADYRKGLLAPLGIEWENEKYSEEEYLEMEKRVVEYLKRDLRIVVLH
mmetsp:Transcript_7238/g.17541  ORF Transcript_7238/g.17541 Transcript_7238/m.17541 type:complete len:263 (-) Transcript_7238:278-1066(-)|eukprot:CAMPEP_0178999954 /NCGR_PEP_ID=MMETSP0795-20121207/10385_1 /TAXON_ID=88552 /ORGANISM="Amoebophrya sp., Strain Ameob2" /LENGTH=262 /DNA_ID=CAMNT_0020692861 /DNA_START=89 /DNA_END=877 /DNA_ORIENTATION=+